ncbi:MAG TPA: septum formation initiator family protein [Thermoanaerobaculia bacterium]
MTRPEAPGRTSSFRPVLGASVLLFLAVLAIAGLKSYRDLESARQSEHLLENRIEATEQQIGRLRNRIDRLRTDPGALERHAREDLGMVRPGDVIIELPQPEEKKAAPVPPPAPVPSPAPSATPPMVVPAADPHPRPLSR